MARREGADRGRREETRVVDRPLIPVAGSPGWVWETDSEGRYVASGEGAKRILGRPSESLLGRRVDEVFARGDPGTEDLLSAHRTPRPLLELVQSVPNGHGQTRTVETVGFPLFASDGHFLGYHGVHRDISDRRLEEEALRVQAEQARRVYAALPVPTCTFRRVRDDFVLVDYNDAMVWLTRGAIRGFKDAPARDVYADRPELVGFLERCWETKGELVREGSYRMLSTGQEKVLRVTGEVLPSDLIVLHVEDLTAAHRTEEALHEVHDRLERVLSAVGEGVLVLDERGTVTSWNRRSLALLGVKMDRLRNRDYLSFVRGEDLARVAAEMAEGDPRALVSYTARLVRGDGSSFQAEAAAVPIVCPEQGSHHGWVVSLRDVTAEEGVARELRATRDLNRKILETAPVWIEVLDAEGRVTLWNEEAQRTSGYQREEVLGEKEVWNWLYPDPVYRQEVREQVHGRLPRIGPFRDLESTIRTKSGEERVIAWQGETLTDDEGNTTGVVAIGHDVTEWKRSEQSLREYATQVAHLSRERSRLLSTASHELRTPLAALRGWADLLTRDESLSPQGRERMERILAQADRLDALVSDLLSVSRLDSGGGALRRQAVDVAAVLERVIRTLRSQIDQKGQGLALPSVPAVVLADEDALEKILTNLLANAIAYTPAGGRIAVRFVPMGESVRVDISDTGMGIGPQDRDRLFEEFYRTEGAKRIAPDGTGLGLSIVKRLVAELGGAVWVASPGSGRGSTFSFTLPRPAGGSG
jgi:PAS domain S-box-containing protein